MQGIEDGAACLCQSFSNVLPPRSASSLNVESGRSREEVLLLLLLLAFSRGRSRPRPFDTFSRAAQTMLSLSTTSDVVVLELVDWLLSLWDVVESPSSSRCKA